MVLNISCTPWVVFQKLGFHSCLVGAELVKTGLKPWPSNWACASVPRTFDIKGWKLRQIVLSATKFSSTEACSELLLFTESCLTLYNPMDCSIPGLPVLHHLPSSPKFMFIASLMPSSCYTCADWQLPHLSRSSLWLRPPYCFIPYHIDTTPF